MPIVKWDPSFNINIEVIDSQHQLLMDVINELYDAMMARQEKEALQKIINKLTYYAVFHFAKEEHYFEVFAFPEAEQHKKQHHDFEATISKFEDDFNQGRQTVSIELINFLSNWLINHIKGSDKRYSAFMIERGLS